MMRQPLLFALTASLVAACGLPGSHELPDPLEPGQPSADPASEAPAPVEPLACQQGISAASCDCTENNCGQNSPVIDGLPFSKLHLGGLPNPQGFSLIAFAVSDAAALAESYFVPGFDVVMNNHFLLNVGNVMVLEREGQKYFVKLVAVSPTSPSPDSQPYWAHVESLLPWYRLEYTTPEELLASPRPRYQDLCKTYPGASEGWNATGAFIFEGNVYNQVTITVESSPRVPANQTWFNVACPGSLPAKMLATRRVDIDGYGASPKEQQAFANMWSGNYCGTGRTFTKPGWPLRIRTRNPLGAVGSIAWNHPASFVAGDVASVDAVWSAEGAVCIDTPRLDTDPMLVDADPAEPGDQTWRHEIEQHCGRSIPRCTKNHEALPAGWQATGYVLSINPVP